jgi:hypothetical protein
MLYDDVMLFHIDVFRAYNMEQERGYLFNIFDIIGVQQVYLYIVLILNIYYAFIPHILRLVKVRRDIEYPGRQGI